MSVKNSLRYLFPPVLIIVVLIIILGIQWPGYSDQTVTNRATDEVTAEFLVNDDFSTADQGYSDIGVDAIGNFWIVWQDNRTGNYSVYAQYFGWDGERFGPNSPVNDDLTNDEQYDPHVGVAVDGYTKIVWQDYRAAGYPTNPDIYAQDILEDGSIIDANAKVNSDFGQAQQRKPNLDMSPSGAAVVVWEDYRNNNWDIYAQWYDNTGSKIGGNVKINDDLNNAVQHRPFVSADGLGNALICWYDNRNGSDDVYGQIFDPTKNKVGGNVLINDAGAASVQKFPASAGLPGGGFVVVWVDYRNGPYPNDPDIFAQKLTATGQKSAVNFRVNADGPNVRQTEPQIGSAPTGGFVVCWRDERRGAADIFAQRYEPDGSTAGLNFMVNTEDEGILQSSPAVAISDAKMYFTWTDNRSSGLFDIYGRIFTYDNPTISPIPSFVLFEAEDGGPNPPAQAVMVANAGAGVLEWAATGNADWLTVTPVSGTAPTTISLSVDLTGLEIGDYSATVAFKDQNDPQITGTLVVTLSIDYGAPIISVTPQALDFQAGLLGAAVDPQEITIENVGGKTLNWQTTLSDDWLIVDPAEGTAPSTAQVSVNAAGLAIGAHTGTISIIDPTAYNPRVDITITCNIFDDSPLISISDTALHFLAFERQGDPPPQQVLIANDGDGALNFSVDSTFADWLSVFPTEGLAPEYVDIAALTDTLVPGLYYDTLWFIDTLASNSPVSLSITLEVDSVPPEIQLSVATLDFQGIRFLEAPPPEQFDISNSGGSDLNWTISHGADWLIVEPDSGMNQQSVDCIIDQSGLDSGEYVDTLFISDPLSSNSPQTIPIGLYVDEPDTLYFSEAMTEAGMAVSMPINLSNVDSISDVSIPLRYDRENVHLDSAVFDGSRIAHWTFRSIITDTIAGTVKMFATSHAVPFPDDPLPPGSGALGHLFFTVTPEALPGTVIEVDTTTLDLSPLSLAETGGTAFVPRVVPGRIEISSMTGVFEEPQTGIIAPLELVNYPNPFNSETVLYLRGVTTEEIDLRIYNVLGQPVCDLSDRVELVGSAARAVWDGANDNGRQLGSGMYFAVCRTAQRRLSQKIILLR